MSSTATTNTSPTTATDTKTHPNSALTPDEIDYFRNINFYGLLLRNKLHLILDLDHTLVHSKPIKSLTIEERESMDSIDDAHVLFDGLIVVKLRPGVTKFLKLVSELFDLSIYSMGNRAYVNGVVELLESQVGFSLFDSKSVFSREDCKNMKKGLDLVMEHEKGILIVDDTESVWEDSAKENLLQIGRYDFWQKQGIQGEEEVDDELAGVFSILEAIYVLFYQDYQYDAASYANNKDVRLVLEMVKKCLVSSQESDDDDDDDQQTDVEGAYDSSDDEMFDFEDMHWNEG